MEPIPEMIPIVDKEKDIGQVDDEAAAIKEMPTKSIAEEQKEYLFGPYLGQYVVYTSPTQAWLL